MRPLRVSPPVSLAAVTLAAVTLAVALPLTASAQRVTKDAAAPPARATTPAATPAAAPADSTSQITVTASRHAVVPGDRAMLAVTVEGAGDAAAEATRRADAVLLGIGETIRQLEGAATLLETVPVTLVETPTASGFRHIPNQPTVRARYLVRVAVPRVADVASVATALLTAGARAATPTFDAAAADSARQTTYVDALAQARRDAEAIAGAMGMRLGPVLEVANAPAPSATTDARTGSGVTPGIDVGSTVTVRYRVLPR